MRIYDVHSIKLAGVPAVVQQKNSLTNEVFGKPFYTPIYIKDGWAYRLNIVQAMRQSGTETKSELAEIEEVPPKESEKSFGQLTLF